RSSAMRATPFPYTTLFRSAGGRIRFLAGVNGTCGKALLVFHVKIRGSLFWHVQPQIRKQIGARDQTEELIAIHHDGDATAIENLDRKSTRLNSSHLGISYA